MNYRNVTFRLILLISLLHKGTPWKPPPQDPFLCYHCGSETDTGYDLPCEKFQPDPMFEGKCSADAYCSKTVTRSGHTVRGCSFKKTTDDDYDHEAGCVFFRNYKMTDVEIMCFCDEPLCNEAPFSYSFCYRVLLINFLAIIFIRVM